MLNSYISSKDVKAETASIALRPILIGFGIVFGLLVIGGLIVVALIPLYIPNRSVAPAPSVLTGINQYNFSFILEEGIDFPVGPLNAATLTVVQNYIRSLLAASNSDILHDGELTLLAASIESVSRSTRKKRAVRDSIAVMTDDDDIPNGRQVLRVIILFRSNRIFTLNLRAEILEALVNLYLVVPLPVPILIIILGTLSTTTTTSTTAITSTTTTSTTSRITTPTTTTVRTPTTTTVRTPTTTTVRTPTTITVRTPPTTTVKTTTTTTVTTTTTKTACTDTIGYYETGTGHTCQTYDDYGFCSDGQINDDMPPAEPEEAIQNCCICGKS